MIIRNLSRAEAIRYLLAHGFVHRPDAEQALDEMSGPPDCVKDYGGLKNEAGADLSWTAHGGFVARYRTRREALESEATDRHVCPRCRAGTGERCLKQSSTNNYWDRHRMKHPHPERVAKVRADASDQGKAGWLQGGESGMTSYAVEEVWTTDLAEIGTIYRIVLADRPRIIAGYAFVTGAWNLGGAVDYRDVDGKPLGKGTEEKKRAMDAAIRGYHMCTDLVTVTHDTGGS